MLIISQLQKLNILIRRNNNFILDIQYKPNNVVFNTNNIVKAYLQIRPYRNNPVMFIEVSTYNGMITFSGEDGGIHINIPYNATRDMPTFDEGFYDLIIFTTDNIAKTIIEGTVQVEKTVGRIADGFGTGVGGTSPGLGKYFISWEYVENKPEFALVATSGDYRDLKNKPTFADVDYRDLSNKPVFATIALTGRYNDLINKPDSFPPSAHTHTYNSLTDKPNPLVFKGNWDTNTAYFVNNVVFYQNSSFIALIPSIGVLPTNTATWQIIAKGVYP